MRITLSEREVMAAIVEYVANEVLRSPADGGEVMSITVASGVYLEVTVSAVPAKGDER